jgi:hypothetical protein
MNGFAHLTPRQLADVFEETAARRGIGRAAIVEKDFWTCWTLAALFGSDGPSGSAGHESTLLFKGGTSLSKAYGLIDRFSEDIDLTVDRMELVGEEGDPSEAGISTRERKRRIQIMAEKCATYVSEIVAVFLRSRGADWGDYKIEVDSQEPQTLHLSYPRALTGASYGGNAYVTAQIRLEFGARGELWPAEQAYITSFAALEFPQLFTEPTTSVQVLSPRRTFREKATILHAIASSGRIGGGERQSRHYADLARLAKAPLGNDARADTGLLLDVAKHKAMYFPSASARYDLARPGTLRLVPSPVLLEDLEKDYKRMQEMFITVPPTFANVIEEIAALERRINDERG